MKWAEAAAYIETRFSNFFLSSGVAASFSEDLNDEPVANLSMVAYAFSVELYVFGTITRLDYKYLSGWAFLFSKINSSIIIDIAFHHCKLLNSLLFCLSFQYYLWVQKSINL